MKETYNIEALRRRLAEWRLPNNDIIPILIYFYVWSINIQGIPRWPAIRSWKNQPSWKNLILEILEKKDTY